MVGRGARLHHGFNEAPAPPEGETGDGLRMTPKNGELRAATDRKPFPNRPAW